MTRLIDANALKESVHAHDYVLKDCLNSTDKGMFTVGIMQAIDEQPTVDPVKHGKWIVWDEIVAGIYHTVSECSECGFTTDKMSREEMPYCPNCGARMDKDERD
jgi:rubrerythrin